MKMINKSEGISYLKGSKKPFSGIGYVLSEETGKKLIESKYSKGHLHGFHSEWWENGKKKRYGRYKEGKRDGRWVEYYENGNIFSENSFKNGIMHGFSNKWHENGTIYYKGKYNKGEKFGSWDYWDTNGKLIEYICIETKFGEIILDLFEDYAPIHAQNFKDHVESGYYNGTTFHRVIANFVIQGGDPNTRLSNRKIHGRGGSASSYHGIGEKSEPLSWKLPEEFNDLQHKRGTLSMARGLDPNSAGSQFFICQRDLPNLDGEYTIFGKVIDGINVLDQIIGVNVDFRDNPFKRIEMNISICN